MLRLTRALWSSGKAVVEDISFCVLKLLLEMRKKGFYGSVLIKRGDIGLLGFDEMPLLITSVRTILVMWDFLVMNGTR